MTETLPTFSNRVDELLAEFFRLNPVHATAAGMHEYDGEWPDLTEAGRARRIAFIDRWEPDLRSIPDAALTRDERVDRDLLLGELAAMRFGETELREEAWDPLEWVYLLGGGLFPLLAREFAPLAARLASAADRLEGIPAVVDAAREQIGGVSGRPVSRFHTETALAQLSGIGELADDAVRAAEEGAPSDQVVEAVATRVQAAAATATKALTAFERHLRTHVLPNSEGEGRLGAELFATKMRHTLKDAELTPARILGRADMEYAAVRAEMIRLARDLWPAWRPDEPLPTAASDGSQEAADQRTVRSVLDAIAGAHQSPDRLLEFCTEELARIEAFCRERELVGLADDPLDIRWTPVFLRAFGGAMLDAPGPLDKGQKSFFSITPIPDDWTPDQAESYLREQNDRMLRLLTIHEGVPGHYLQGAYANRCPSIARAVFWSGVYAEGWAVYVTQVMMDAGYGADDPALLLVNWKFYLRTVTNAMIDARIHAGDAFDGPMTEDEAVRLMVEGGFQEEAEARNKYNRARLTSTQLSTYFVGSMAMWELEAEVRGRLAEATGDPRGGTAVPDRALPGGLGDTPGFNYRAHLEAVMAHGSPPMPLLRRLVLDEA